MDFLRRTEINNKISNSVLIEASVSNQRKSVQGYMTKYTRILLITMHQSVSLSG